MTEIAKRATDSAVAEMLAKVKTERRASRARLVFAIDATASRQPTWDTACHVQAQMFEAAEGMGGIEVQLVFYRGKDQCRASRWITSTRDLVDLMTGIMCRAGHTQINKVLAHVVREHEKAPVAALVFVGDTFEEKRVEGLDAVAGAGIRCFMFHEGGFGPAKHVFQQVARETGGAYCPFDQGSAAQLRDLLGAVAAYAVGGVKALADIRDSKAARLISNQVH